MVNIARTLLFTTSALFRLSRRKLSTRTTSAGLCLSGSQNIVRSLPFGPTYWVVRNIHLTSSQRALEEFFDDPKNYGELRVRSGRAWRQDELRLKSNSDLHKLWFVLYKERNMLYTMQEAAKTEFELFPSPERIDKVEESMQNLECVVMERNKAYWQLEVSPCATGQRPEVFRRDVFGRPRWHKCSQHLAPYFRNAKFRETQGPGKHHEVESFFRHYREMKRKIYNYDRSKTARYIRDILRRFPDCDIDYLAELHPEFPPGYIKHLKENLQLYDDPPRRMFRLGLKDMTKQLEASHRDSDSLLSERQTRSNS